MAKDKKDLYFLFLDRLRESGVVNMFGAAPYLEVSFPELKKTKTARAVLLEWMESFEARHTDCDPV